MNDLTGRCFNRWTVLQRAGNDQCGNLLWLCHCICGEERAVVGSSLIAGNTRSCGCYSRERTAATKTSHGHTVQRKGTPTYTTWRGMISRCENPKRENWKYYGGRGITVCQEWRDSFAAFLRDMGLRPSRVYSIDRIDPDGDYEPKNCHWATRLQQRHNRRKAI